MNLGSNLNLNMSSKVIPTSKAKATLTNDSNIIICPKDYTDLNRLIKFVKSRDNWKLRIVDDKEENKIQNLLDDDDDD